VETGQNEGDQVEIVSGLSEGETVYYGGAGYAPQQDSSGSNPLIPSRPKMNRQQQRAVRGR
jgi:hypothetical protein